MKIPCKVCNSTRYRKTLNDKGICRGCESSASDIYYKMATRKPLSQIDKLWINIYESKIIQ